MGPVHIPSKFHPTQDQDLGLSHGSLGGETTTLCGESSPIETRSFFQELPETAGCGGKVVGRCE